MPTTGTAAPTLPLTYTDIVCIDDCDPLMSETTSDLQNLEQDVRHILMETLGSNLDDVNRGIGVDSLLSSSTAPLQTLAKNLDSQLTKDDRIQSSNSNVIDNGSGSFTLNVTVAVAGKVTGLAFAFDAAGNLLP